jgi:UDP-glucose 4-epimerase
VLVVGADGFLGINCVKALLALDAEVTILSRNSKPRLAEFKGRFVHGDLDDHALIADLVKGQSVVFDCVGSSGALKSNCEISKNFVTECKPHLILFEACAHDNAKPVVVFLSSRLVYGCPTYLPVDEKHPLNPDSMYAAHKVALENYLLVLNKIEELPYCILRLSNPYGPGPSHAGKDYGIINQFIRAAAEGKTITIFGDGAQKRDYIYVDDVIQAMLSVPANPHCHNQTYNLGGSEAISIHDAVEVIVNSAGGDASTRYIEWPNDALRIETGDYQSDMTSLHHGLKLPEQIPFEQGIAKTLLHLTGSGIKSEHQ